MIKIKEFMPKNGIMWELEDGTFLYEFEWNGELFICKENGKEVRYKPIYRQVDNEDFEAIGFDEL